MAIPRISRKKAIPEALNKRIRQLRDRANELQRISRESGPQWNDLPLTENMNLIFQHALIQIRAEIGFAQ